MRTQSVWLTNAPTSAERVEADREEEGRREEEQRLRSEEVQDGRVVRELDHDVHDDPAVEERNLFQARGTRELEEREEQEPQGLRGRRVPHEARLPAVREVRVQLVHALEGVVLEVVLLERHRAREQVRQVRRHREDLVPRAALHDEVVRAVVDEDPERVARERADEPSRGEDDPDGLPGEEPAAAVWKATSAAMRTALHGLRPASFRISACALRISFARAACGSRPAAKTNVEGAAAGAGEESWLLMGAPFRGASLSLASGPRHQSRPRERR